jgi:hypothetical protein
MNELQIRGHNGSIIGPIPCVILAWLQGSLALTPAYIVVSGWIGQQIWDNVISSQYISTWKAGPGLCLAVQVKVELK